MFVHGLSALNTQIYDIRSQFEIQRTRSLLILIHLTFGDPLPTALINYFACIVNKKKTIFYSGTMFIRQVQFLD